MTIRPTVLIAALLLLAAGPSLAQPERVPRLTERHLDKASYVELARQWKAWIDEHGETADALVNLGMAYDYSEELDAAVVAARRAVELGPDNPEALHFLGKMLSTYVDDQDEARKILTHCREVAPQFEPGLTTLAVVHMRQGDFDEAMRVFKTVFDQRVIAPPLQDFAYNMLVGLPEGAVLITSGDNDTFPPLALQAGMKLRPDVIVVNRSLMNDPTYVKAIFTKHPEIEPEYDIDTHEVKLDDEGNYTLLSNVLLEKMIEAQKRPIHIAATAAFEYHGYEPGEAIEGITLRTTSNGLSAEESAQLILNEYRLDSATDWNYPWSLIPTVSKLMQNYVTSMAKLAEYDGIRTDTRSRLLDRALEIAEFHEFDRLTRYVKSLQKS